MLGSCGRTIVAWRWVVLTAWVALAAGLLLWAPSINPVANEQVSFLPETAGSVRATDAIAKHFPDSSGLSTAVVVVERPAGEGGALTAADRKAVETLAGALRDPLPNTIARDLGHKKLSVRAPGDFLLLQVNPMVRQDDRGGAAMIRVEVPANFVTTRSAMVTAYVRKLARATDWPQGLSVAVTGSAAFGADYAEATHRSDHNSRWVTVVAVLVILLIVYRAPFAAGLVLVSISLAAIVAISALKLTAALGLHVGTLEQMFVFVLLYGAGVDYSLLYLSRFREEQQSAPPLQAGAVALAATAATILASAGTDIIGLAMLAAADFKIFQTTGKAVAIALGVSTLAVLTLVPAAGAVLKGRVFWPAKLSAPRTRSVWPAVARVVTTHPWIVALVTTAVLAVPAAQAFRIQFVYDTFTGLDKRYGAVQGIDMIRRHWPAGQTAPVTVIVTSTEDQAPEDFAPTAAKLTRALKDLPGVADVRSLSQPLGNATDAQTLMFVPGAQQAAAAQYLGPEGQATRLSVILNDPPFSLEAMATVAAIGHTVNEHLPAGLTAGLAGSTAEMSDVRSVTTKDFHRIALLALATIFLIVMALLRDWILSAFMIASTVLSYLATLGAVSFLFVHVLGQGDLDWKVEVMLFVVMVAVGQDYNIFLAARLAEESRHAPPREAARIAIVKTGGIISSAGLIMAATLGSLMVGDIILLVQLGVAFALGMLLDTFIVRPLLLPAFAVITGRTGKPLRFGRP